MLIVCPIFDPRVTYGQKVCRTSPYALADFLILCQSQSTLSGWEKLQGIKLFKGLGGGMCGNMDKLFDI